MDCFALTRVILLLLTDVVQPTSCRDPKVRRHLYQSFRTCSQDLHLTPRSTSVCSPSRRPWDHAIQQNDSNLLTALLIPQIGQLLTSGDVSDCNPIRPLPRIAESALIIEPARIASAADIAAGIGKLRLSCMCSSPACAPLSLQSSPGHEISSTALTLCPLQHASWRSGLHRD